MVKKSALTSSVQEFLLSKLVESHRPCLTINRREAPLQLVQLEHHIKISQLPQDQHVHRYNPGL